MMVFRRRSNNVVPIAARVWMASGYFSTNVTVFWVLRFLVGATSSAAFITSYVICAELTSVRHQNVSNFVFHACADFIGGAFYIITTYLVQEWRLVTAFVSIPHFFAILFPFLIPESPRWGLTVDRRKEALSVLKRASEVNQKYRCSSRGPNKPLSDQDVTALMQSLMNPDQEETDTDEEVTWKSLFTNKLYLARFCCLTFLWVSEGIVFFAIFFFAVRLEGSPYVIAEVMACFSMTVVAVKTGIYHFFSRKKPLLITYFLLCFFMGMSTVSLHFLPEHFLSVALSLLSYSLSHLAFMMLYTVSSSFFPTGARNLAMGLLLGLSRVGCALAPFVEKLDSITGLKWLPFVFMASLMGASMVVCGLMKFPSSCEKKVSLDVRMEEKEEEEGFL